MDNTTDFKYRVAQVLSNEYRQFDTVPVCDTPELVRSVGFSNGEIHMTQKHIRNCLAPEETGTDDERHHDLPIDFMDNLPQYIENPAMILSSLSHQNGRVVLVTDCKDKKERPIIIALQNDGVGRMGGRITPCNILVSTYGRKGFADFLKRSIEANGANNGLLYWNEKKSRDLVVSAGLQLPRVLAKYDSNVIIRKFNENVNTFKQINLDFSPDGYGDTHYRKDGKPFTYFDPDGRQKLYEYTKGRNDEDVLSSSTATFSDGRSEITRYDERGEVIGIERKDAEGRKTYVYSCSQNGAQHETSYEHFGGANTHYDYDDWEFGTPRCKSVHEKEHKKEEGRYGYCDKFQEDWHEYDDSYNMTLAKHNEYRDNGITPEKYYCSENRFEHDRYGNVTSATYKDRDGTSVIKNSYYPPSEVSGYFDYGIDEYDAGAIDHNKVKTETARYPDGRISVKAYKLDGNYTESDYSPDGKLTAFRAENGETFKGKAAELALLRSSGQAPTSADVAATKARRQPQANAKCSKSSKGKPSGKGNGGRGSSGAGR